jgi:uncharacterized protein YxeA
MYLLLCIILFIIIFIIYLFIYYINNNNNNNNLFLRSRPSQHTTSKDETHVFNHYIYEYYSSAYGSLYILNNKQPSIIIF